MPTPPIANTHLLIGEIRRWLAAGEAQAEGATVRVPYMHDKVVAFHRAHADVLTPTFIQNVRSCLSDVGVGAVIDFSDPEHTVVLVDARLNSALPAAEFRKKPVRAEWLDARGGVASKWNPVRAAPPAARDSSKRHCAGLAAAGRLGWATEVRLGARVVAPLCYHASEVVDQTATHWLLADGERVAKAGPFVIVMD